MIFTQFSAYAAASDVTACAKQLCIKIAEYVSSFPILTVSARARVFFFYLRFETLVFNLLINLDFYAEWYSFSTV